MVLGLLVFKNNFYVMAPSSVSRTTLRAFDLQAPTRPPFLLFTVTTQLSKAASPFLSSLPPGPSPSPTAGRPAEPHQGPAPCGARLGPAHGRPPWPCTVPWAFPEAPSLPPGGGALARWLGCDVRFLFTVILPFWCSLSSGCGEGMAVQSLSSPSCFSYLLGRKCWKSGNSIHHCP